MLFEPYNMRSLQLSNRVVMSPMTRSRAPEHATPNKMMAEYYGQRAGAGLIVTEGTSPSPNGVGYARIPGLYNEEQVSGWRLVTDAVHAKGGRIVIQLMHTGRVTHVINLPAGARVVAPTATVLPGQMYTDAQGMQDHSVPAAMTEGDIATAVEEFAQSARLAVKAGFDGIELHSANGYLLEQFLNANVNTRTDGYGGSAANRNRFVLEVARAAVKAIGADKVGIRLSPYGVFNSTGPYPDLEEQYVALVEELSSMGLLYVHVLDHSAMGTPPVPAAFKAVLRSTFKGPFILAGGYNRDTAEQAIKAHQADLIGFGRPFISNPDLVSRMQNNLPLADPDMSTFYTPGAKGYVDYPATA